MTVADCIKDINDINVLVERYRNIKPQMVYLNPIDADKVFELLYNYKTILNQMTVSNILLGDN